jgi:hypothetical protein
VVVMAVYLLLLPFVTRTWRATGDEPHYLLAAHSLGIDGDLDLANNYANLDYLNFYFSQDIVRQVRYTESGQEILDHYPALPLLVTPAYLMGGRFGVLLLQTLFGGLLATLMFYLSHLISGDTLSSLLATALVAFSLPLLAYPYLVYPEWLAAVLVMLVVYSLVTRSHPTGGVMAGLVIALAILPWLNRRFIVLAVVLAIVAFWIWRREGRLSLMAVLPLLVIALSAGGSFWFNNQLPAPVRTDITVPASNAELWQRLVRGIGWLVDQQRGLFIFAPIYIAGLWGLPAFIRYNGPIRGRRWIMLLPFVLTLLLVTMAGGFWIAWELGPRFLVVGLPGLAPLLALAWRDLGRTVPGAVLLALLAVMSLLNSWIVMRNPELPYKSSLPIYFGELFSVPLTDLLPDMAGYERLTPDPNTPGPAAVVERSGQFFWAAPAGRPQQLLDSGPLNELPFGHYLLDWQLAVPSGMPPDTELARLSLKRLGGGHVFEQSVWAEMLPASGQGTVSFSFFNANPDRWRTPMILFSRTTGAVDLLAGDFLFKPNPLYAFWLPYIYLALCTVGMALVWIMVPPRPGRSWPAPGKWTIILVMAVLVGVTGYLTWVMNASVRNYNAVHLNHLVGEEINDSQAVDNAAWLVDPATDPPQKAVYGPFEIFDAGQYRVIFRIKLPNPAEPDTQVARLQIKAAAGSEALVTQTVLGEHFVSNDQYHDMILTVDNPRRQALSFEVFYLATAPLTIDQITVIAGTP